MQAPKPFQENNMPKPKATTMFETSIPAEIPQHRCTYTVHGVERIRNGNNGRMLTLAIADWTRLGFSTVHHVRDIVTMMQLADMTSNKHSLPINADKLYGPRGRRVNVTRAEST